MAALCAADSDPLSPPDQCFCFFFTVPDNIIIHYNPVFLKTQNNGGASELKVPLLHALADPRLLMMIVDFPHQHGACFHHQHSPEFLCFQQAELSCIFFIYRYPADCGRIYSVENAGNTDIF